jgi:hypothetical protein
MSAIRIDWHDYLDTVCRQAPPLHLAAASTIYEWLLEAGAAAERGDAGNVVRLLGLVRGKVVQELRWQAESCAAAHAYRAAYSFRRQSDWLPAWCQAINRQSAERAQAVEQPAGLSADIGAQAIETPADFRADTSGYLHGALIAACSKKSTMRTWKP